MDVRWQGVEDAASCNKWLMEDIFRTTDYAAEQAGITRDMLGRNHVYFLP